MSGNEGKKVLLALMPFWSPLTPPLGISVLKSHLKQQGTAVSTYDFNTEDDLWEILDRYFAILKDVVPADRQGNFHMVAFDVLGNHLVAFLHKQSQDDRYRRLLKLIFKENYFVEIGDSVAGDMDRVVSEFYTVLDRSITKLIETNKPDVLGLSVYSPTLGPSVFTFKRVKERFPQVKTVMGGGVFADHLEVNSPNFSYFWEKTNSFIDAIIVGEGELLLEKYLAGGLDPGKRIYTLDDIDRENLDLSRATPADFSGLKLSAYLQMATYATRSCPFQCNFCSETVQWGRFRKKGAQQIVNEIEQLKTGQGGKLFLFGDSLVNPVIDDLSRRLIETRADIYWDAYLRTDAEVCDPAKTELWRQGGFYRARLGVESGSQHVLDLMNKKMPVDQIKKALSTLANAGIKTTVYLVIGYPGETEEDFRETLEMITEMKDDIYEVDWHPFYFFPRGQVSSGRWVQEHGSQLLYPEEFSGLLLTRTWTLNCSPARQEIYSRLNRLGQTCKKHGIPNPYSIFEIYQADLRWKELHAKAGNMPTVLELHNQNWLNEG